MTDQNRTSSAAFVVMILGVAVVLLVWNGISRYHENLSLHHRLVERVTNAAASEVSQEIRELKRRVALFSEIESDLLSRVVLDPLDDISYQTLVSLVNQHFTGQLGFAVTGPEGELMAATHPGIDDPRLLEDIAAFARGAHTYRPYLYPVDDGYHFVIMTRWATLGGARGAFLVSFRPERVALLLKKYEIDNHRLLLVRSTDPALIEMTGMGARGAQGSPSRLDADARERLITSREVPGTGWVVVDRPSEAVYNEIKGDIARNTGLFISALVAMTVVLLRYLRKAEERRMRTESMLQSTHHELELRVRDRTRQLTEVNQELHDVVERQRVAEHTLREREATLRAVLESTVDAIVVIDEYGSIRSFNRAAEEMFGYSAEEVMDMNVNMLMPSPHREQHDRYLSRYLETGKRHIIGIGRRVEGRHKDGSIFPIDLAVSEARIGKHRVYTGILRRPMEDREEQVDVA